MPHDTLTPGLKTGSILIDNLDVTTEGGIGRGANDGNDVINMSLNVLDHATPSFAADSLQPNLVHDFGVIEVGSEPPTFEFEIFNLAGMPDFTADLELDSVVGTGDTNVLATDLAPFTGADSLQAGSVGTSFTATLSTEMLGSFAATYTLSFSDEDLPGATGLSDLQIMLTGTVDFTRRRQFEVLSGVGSRANLGDGGRTHRRSRNQEAAHSYLAWSFACSSKAAVIYRDLPSRSHHINQSLHDDGRSIQNIFGPSQRCSL